MVTKRRVWRGHRLGRGESQEKCSKLPVRAGTTPTMSLLRASQPEPLLSKASKRKFTPCPSVWQGSAPGCPCRVPAWGSSHPGALLLPLALSSRLWGFAFPLVTQKRWISAEVLLRRKHWTAVSRNISPNPGCGFECVTPTSGLTY